MNRPELFPLLLEAYHEHRAQLAGVLICLAAKDRTNVAAERFALRTCLRSGESPPEGALTGPRAMLWRVWVALAPARSAPRWKALRSVLEEMADEGAGEDVDAMLREAELADGRVDALAWARRAWVESGE